MTADNGFSTENRAVSPVIAVILMVAITVILASVVGTFVLDIGSSLSEGPPSAVFSAEQEEMTIGGLQTPVVSLTVESTADTLREKQLFVTVNGNTAFGRDPDRHGGDGVALLWATVEQYRPYGIDWDSSETLAVGEEATVVGQWSSFVGYQERPGGLDSKWNYRKNNGDQLGIYNNGQHRFVKRDTGLSQGDVIRIVWQSTDQSQILYEYTVQ